MATPRETHRNELTDWANAGNQRRHVSAARLIELYFQETLRFHGAHVVLGFPEPTGAADSRQVNVWNLFPSWFTALSETLLGDAAIFDEALVSAQSAKTWMLPGQEAKQC